MDEVCCRILRIYRRYNFLLPYCKPVESVNKIQCQWWTYQLSHSQCQEMPQRGFRGTAIRMMQITHHAASSNACMSYHIWIPGCIKMIWFDGTVLSKSLHKVSHCLYISWRRAKAAEQASIVLAEAVGGVVELLSAELDLKGATPLLGSYK